MTGVGGVRVGEEGRRGRVRCVGEGRRGGVQTWPRTGDADLAQLRRVGVCDLKHEAAAQHQLDVHAAVGAVLDVFERDACSRGAVRGVGVEREGGGCGGTEEGDEQPIRMRGGEGGGSGG